MTRSPAAEIIARHLVGSGAYGRLGVVSFSSAGISAKNGTRMDPKMATLMRPYGEGSDNHRAQRLTADAVDRANLVLGATREHVLAVAELFPEAIHRSFTLRGFVRRIAPITSPQQFGFGVGPLADIGFSIEPTMLLNAPNSDDLADPTGHRTGHYRRCVRQITQDCTQLAEWVSRTR